MSWVDEFTKQKKQEPLIPRRSYGLFDKFSTVREKPTNIYENRKIGKNRSKMYGCDVNK
jgi:hypothetical protein